MLAIAECVALVSKLITHSTPKMKTTDTKKENNKVYFIMQLQYVLLERRLLHLFAVLYESGEHCLAFAW